MGVMKNWQNWQITSAEEVLKYSTGKYANYNVGVVANVASVVTAFSISMHRA
jgi:hypothetical protein